MARPAALLCFGNAKPFVPHVARSGVLLKRAIIVSATSAVLTLGVYIHLFLTNQILKHPIFPIILNLSLGIESVFEGKRFLRGQTHLGHRH